MSLKAKGSCLCKAVQFSFTLKHKHFDACHCTMCRIWGGGPSFTVESNGDIEEVVSTRDNRPTYQFSRKHQLHQVRAI